MSDLGSRECRATTYDDGSAPKIGYGDGDAVAQVYYGNGVTPNVQYEDRDQNPPAAPYADYDPAADVADANTELTVDPWKNYFNRPLDLDGPRANANTDMTVPAAATNAPVTVSASGGDTLLVGHTYRPDVKATSPPDLSPARILDTLAARLGKVAGVASEIAGRLKDTYLPAAPESAAMSTGTDADGNPLPMQRVTILTPITKVSGRNGGTAEAERAIDAAAAAILGAHTGHRPGQAVTIGTSKLAAKLMNPSVIARELNTLNTHGERSLSALVTAAECLDPNKEQQRGVPGRMVRRASEPLTSRILPGILADMRHGARNSPPGLLRAANRAVAERYGNQHQHTHGTRLAGSLIGMAIEKFGAQIAHNRDAVDAVDAVDAASELSTVEAEGLLKRFTIALKAGRDNEGLPRELEELRAAINHRDRLMDVATSMRNRITAQGGDPTEYQEYTALANQLLKLTPQAIAVGHYNRAQMVQEDRRDRHDQAARVRAAKLRSTYERVDAAERYDEYIGQQPAALSEVLHQAVSVRETQAHEYTPNGRNPADLTDPLMALYERGRGGDANAARTFRREWPAVAQLAVQELHDDLDDVRAGKMSPATATFLNGLKRGGPETAELRDAYNNAAHNYYGVPVTLPNSPVGHAIRAGFAEALREGGLPDGDSRVGLKVLTTAERDRRLLRVTHHVPTHQLPLPLRQRVNVAAQREERRDRETIRQQRIAKMHSFVRGLLPQAVIPQ